MNLLAIETSLFQCSIALLHNGTISSLEADQPFQQSTQLFPLLDKLLKQNTLRLQDIHAIACTVGPGSFTGVRIGIAAARAISKIIPHIKLLGISTLELIACAARNSSRQLAGTIKDENHYHQPVELRNSPCHSVGAPKDENPAHHQPSSRGLLSLSKGAVAIHLFQMESQYGLPRVCCAAPRNDGAPASDFHSDDHDGTDFHPHNTGSIFVAVLEASRDEFYMQKFSCDIKPLTDIILINQELLHQQLQQNEIVVSNKVMPVTANLVLKRGLELLEAGVVHNAIHPLYIKAPSISKQKS